MKRNKINQQQFLKRLEEFYSQNVEISRRKNADYANSDDPFKNFRVIEWLTGGATTVEDGILVRMSDKMSRIATLLKQDALVKDEKIKDTLQDLANYAMILAIYLEQNDWKRSRIIFSSLFIRILILYPYMVTLRWKRKSYQKEIN